MGRVFAQYDISETEKIIQKVSTRMERQEARNESLAESSAFNMVLLAKKYDDWFLDPIVGVLLPGIGDVISSAAMLPGLYVAMFRLRSFRLTLAVFCCGMIDLLVGLIPALGDLIDAFYKSNKITARLIIGYAENDPDVMAEINKKASWGVVMLIIIALIVYFLYEAIMSMYHWFATLF